LNSKVVILTVLQVTNRYIAQLKDAHRNHPVVRDFFTKVRLLHVYNK